MENWNDYTKVAKNREDANSWINKFESVRQGIIPMEQIQPCPHGGTHIHIYVDNLPGNNIIACEKCWIHSGWRERVG